MLHNKACSVPAVRPDLAVAGLPCTPCSKLRQKTGNTAGTSAPAQHPAFSIIFEDWFSYLKFRRPRGFIVEEVETFATAVDGQGVSFLARFCKMCAKLGYEVRVLKCDHGIWVEISRVRVWIVGFGPELGGKDAADSFTVLAREVSAYRRLTPPTKVWDIVDPDGVQESSKRKLKEHLKWITEYACQLKKT